jgi:gliding motility-associated-like protein
MKINYYLLSVLLCAFTFQSLNGLKAQGTTNPSGGGTTGPSAKVLWSVNPFDDQIFIENAGQYDGKIKTGEQILFAARVGLGFAYFTKSGVVYRYDEFLDDKGKPCISPDKKLEEHDKKEREKIKDVPEFLTATWKGSNPTVTITKDGKMGAPYNFPLGEGSHCTKSVQTWAYKTITYNNIYPGIDAEYSFIQGKGGIKYNLIVHPGANLAQVKLAYSGAKEMKIDKDGNLVVGSSFGTLTDHAPVSHYAESGQSVGTSYQIVGNEETFSVDNLNTDNTLVIDPWTTIWTTNTPITSSSGNDGCYDVDYDYYGNVYVYGGNNPYSVVKMNSAGAIQWTYVTSNFTYQYYGAFAVEKTSGSVFACEGFGSTTGAITDKINNAGALAIPPFTSSDSSDEDWRMAYDICNNEIVIAGGGTYDRYQATILDTNLGNGNHYVNVLGFPNSNFPYCYHDMYGIAMDPFDGFCYMAPAHTLSSSLDNNDLIKLPIPTLSPTIYNVPDGLHFQEVFSIAYVNTGVGNANGMNCMAANSNFVYMYDGKNLREFNAGTGAFITSAVLPGSTSYDWGGTCVDICGNVYLGNQTDVDIYNSSLSSIGTITGFSGNVYDDMIGYGVPGYGDTTLYVSGKGFVSRLAISGMNPPKIEKTQHKVCSCNCTAEATLYECGAKDTIGITYKWSNGQTTRTATGLCPGSVDTISIYVGCIMLLQDTVNITNTGLLNITKNQTNATCVNPGTASVTVNGGNPPYTYLWSNGATTTSIGGLGAGIDSVTIWDNKGCNDTVCFIISGTPLPTITITPPIDTVCAGSGAVLQAGGGVSYVWAPTNGLNCATCSSLTASPLTTTTYTVSGTDVNGCVNKDSITITVEPLPTIVLTAVNDTVCATQSTTVTATGALTYNWTPVTSQLSSQTGSSVTVTPTVTTTYTVTGTDSHGCDSSSTITIYLAQPPTISVSATRTSMCEGFSTTLMAAATNVTGPFTWQPVNITAPVITVTPTVTTTYTVSAPSGCGQAIATITINVNQLPTTALSADVRNNCAPFCVQFRDKSTSSSGNITQWAWNFGNGDSSLTRDPIYCYPKSGDFSITLTTLTDSGCSSTITEYNYITVYSHPDGAFTMSPQPTTILQSTIQFTDASTDAYGLSYWQWNFGVPGNDTLNYLENPTYTYWDTGTFCASLVVTNQHGCTDTVTNCLVIDPVFALYIPSAFTPNGDGKNEVFKAVGNDITSFEMYIFDRWGMQLFHSTDINDGWDGTYKGGTVAQEDTYVYVITAYDHNHKKHSYIGKVTLIK